VTTSRPGRERPRAAGTTDGVDEAALAPLLRTAWLGRRHAHFAACASTNDVAATEARAGAAAGLLVTADVQSGGRGRLGRTWHSPAGENLTFSVVLRPRRPAAEIPPITLLTGAAVAATLRALGFAGAVVKWPNDVLLDSRKVAGILTEASTEGERIAHVVVGVGLNVNTTSFPSELAARATSLRLARPGGTPLPRSPLLAQLLAELEAAYQRFDRDGAPAAVSAWEQHAALGARMRATADNQTIVGIAVGVASDGALLLRDDAGTIHRIVAGEVLAI
jgi:BirA family transcriptional regulator, biotin operon repressor / biotin---[acetyl-CoA-carboxylase] ligase